MENTMKETMDRLELKGKYHSGLGRRKEAVARVRLYGGSGRIFVNGKNVDELFNLEQAKPIITAPLSVLGYNQKFDISAVVDGGGKMGQLDAIRLGVARALVEYNEDYKTTLRKSGFLTRDPRIKERKKYGLKRARKAPQFSKR
jgi:small subunit ribosomal protein S9